MTCLDSVVDVLSHRLIWLGVSAAPISLEEARREVPILDQPLRLGGAVPVRLGESASRHVVLEAPPNRLLLSVYEVRGPDHAARARRIQQMAAAINQSFLFRSWTYAFIDRDIDLFIVFFGLQVSSQGRMDELLRSLITKESVTALARIWEAAPAPSAGGQGAGAEPP